MNLEVISSEFKSFFKQVGGNEGDFIFVDYGMRRILVLQTLKRSGGKSAVSHPEASSGLEA